MPKALVASTPLARKVIAKLKLLAETLSLGQRLIFPKFEEHILNNRSAISHATGLSPVDAMILVILFSEIERINGIHNKLYSRIEDLEDELEALGVQSPTSEKQS